MMKGVLLFVIFVFGVIGQINTNEEHKNLITSLPGLVS